MPAAESLPVDPLQEVSAELSVAYNFKTSPCNFQFAGCH